MKKLNIFFAVLATTVIAGCGNSGKQEEAKTAETVAALPRPLNIQHIIACGKVKGWCTTCLYTLHSNCDKVA